MIPSPCGPVICVVLDDDPIGIVQLAVYDDAGAGEMVVLLVDGLSAGHAQLGDAALALAELELLGIAVEWLEDAT